MQTFVIFECLHFLSYQYRKNKRKIGGIFLIYPVSWALGVVLMVLYTWKGKWMVAEQAKD